MEEADVSVRANLMVRLHGATAEMIAMDALDKALERGDSSSFDDWTQIATKVARSLRQEARRDDFSASKEPAKRVA